MLATFNPSRRIKTETTSQTRVVSAPEPRRRTVVAEERRVLAAGRTVPSQRVVQRASSAGATPAPRARLVAREETPKPNGSNLPTATGTPATGSPATGVVSVSRGSVRLVSSGLTERRVEEKKKVAPEVVKKVRVRRQNSSKVTLRGRTVLLPRQADENNENDGNANAHVTAPTRVQRPARPAATVELRPSHKDEAEDLRSQALRFKKEREAFQEEMELMLQRARERKAREDALAQEVETYELKRVEAQRRQQRLEQQKEELQRRKEELHNDEAAAIVEGESIQNLNAELSREAKSHHERKELLRKEKEEFQHRSSEMLKRQKARERQEEELRRLIKEVDDAVNPPQTLRTARRPETPTRTVSDGKDAKASHKRHRREKAEPVMESVGCAMPKESKRRKVTREVELPPVDDKTRPRKARLVKVRKAHAPDPVERGEVAAPVSPVASPMGDFDYEMPPTELEPTEPAEPPLEDEAYLEGEEEEEEADFVEDAEEELDPAQEAPSEPAESEAPVEEPRDEDVPPEAPEEQDPLFEAAAASVKEEVEAELPKSATEERWQMMSRSPSRRRNEDERRREQHRRHVERRRAEVREGQAGQESEPGISKVFGH
eukprot:symbB.v1.2.005028.t1/scaffold287.1/size239285/6